MAYGLRKQLGTRAQGGYKRIAKKLENFKPIRYTSLYGTSTMTPQGASFAPTEEFAARQREVGDFWGQANQALLAYDPAAASNQTLDLLRQRRATLFDQNVSNMESRLLQQGRLGLGTGAYGANPEMAGLFSAEAQADLEAQLIAEQESRNRGEYLYGMASGARGLFDSVADPGLQGLFGTAGFIQDSRYRAAEMRARGIDTKTAQLGRGAQDLHEFGMSAWNGFTGGSMRGTTQNPQGSTSTGSQ